MAQLLHKTQVPNSQPAGAPALLGFDEVSPNVRRGLYVGWTKPPNPQLPSDRLDMKFSPDGLNFSGTVETSSIAPIGSPALARFFDQLHQQHRIVVGAARFSSGDLLAEAFATNAPPPPVQISHAQWDINDGFLAMEGSQTSQNSPGLASHDGRLHLAWSDAASQQLRIAFAEFAGFLTGFIGTFASPETIVGAPALCSIGGLLFIAWTGSDGRLNVGRVDLSDGRATAIHKRTFDETSRSGPALGALGDALYIAWAGTDNRLNVMNVGKLGPLGAFFLPNSLIGRFFHLGGKFTAGETARGSPAIASFDGRFFIAWRNMLPELDNHVRVAEIEMTDLAPFAFIRPRPIPRFG